MHAAVLHGAAAGLADVLGEGAGLCPRHDLVLTVRAGHLAGGLQGHEALVSRRRGHAGGLEVHRVTLAAGDGAVGRRRRMGGGRAGAEEAGRGQGGEEEQSCFHRMW